MLGSRKALLYLAFLSAFFLAGCMEDLIITLDKTASPTTFTNTGEVITYNFAVSNKEPFSVYVSVSDSKVYPVNCPKDFLYSGESMTCTGQYTTTEADVAAGSITNTARVFADYSGCSTRNGEASDSVTIHRIVLAPPVQNVDAQAALEMTMTANPECYYEVDQIIVYTYNVHNIGAAAVEGPFQVVDNKVDQWDCDDQGVSGYTLGIDEWITCHGYYKVRAGDVGSPLDSIAHVEGFYNGTTVSSNPASASVCSSVTEEDKDKPDCGSYCP